MRGRYGVMALTPKQQRFVDEYMIDLNGTQAAIRAGYAESGARTEGARLLANANVAAAIAAVQAERAQRTEITADRVLRELARIGFADLRKLLKWTGNQPQMDEAECEETEDIEITAANFIRLFDSDQLDDDTAAAISEISQTRDGSLKVKLHDKQAALVAIGRHLGMFKDRVEHTGKDGGPIQTEEVSARDMLLSRIAGLAERSGPTIGNSKPH